MPEFGERADWQTAATGKRQTTITNTTMQARLERIVSALLKLRFSASAGLEQEEAEYVEGANMQDKKFLLAARTETDGIFKPCSSARAQS